MKNKIIDVIFYIFVALLLSFLAMGLSEITDERVYFFGYEIGLIFLVILVGFFSREIITSKKFKTSLNLKKDITLYLYRYFTILLVSIIILPIIIFFLEMNGESNEVIRFTFPVFTFVFAIDIIISIYINSLNHDSLDSNNYSMKPKMTTLVLIPTTIISVSGVLGLLISNVLWVMIFALFVITALIKFYVINRLNGKLRNK